MINKNAFIQTSIRTFKVLKKFQQVKYIHKIDDKTFREFIEGINEIRFWFGKYKKQLAEYRVYPHKDLSYAYMIEKDIKRISSEKSIYVKFFPNRYEKENLKFENYAKFKTKTGIDITEIIEI